MAAGAGGEDPEGGVMTTYETYGEFVARLARIDPGVKPRPGPADYWQLYVWERPRNVIPPKKPKMILMTLPRWMLGSDISGYKQCRQCEGFLERSGGFHKDLGSPDNLRPICKNCCAKKSASNYAKNGAAMREASRARGATPQYKAQRKARRERTMDKIRVASREYALRRPDVLKKATDKWRAKPQSEEFLKKRNEQRRETDRRHPLTRKLGIARYRAKLKARRLHSISSTDLQARISVFGDKCAYCGAAWSRLDHLKPIARGGPHCLSNLRPACASCNHRKSSKPAFGVARDGP
jgi:5-methylcytosine-specific restriction endonuclease McrA